MTPVPHLTWEKRLKKRSSEKGRSLTRFDSIRELLRKRSNIFAFIMCAAGVALNILLSNEVTVLDLPLYLDTAGTIAVAVMGGYLPGVIVGFATNFIRCIYNTTSVYYGVLSVLIAVAATFLANRGWHRKLPGIAGMVLVFSIIGGLLGGIIPWFIEGISFAGEGVRNVIFETGHVNLITAHLLSSFIIDIPDKLITTLLALLAVRLIPSGFHRYFRFYLWAQDPIAYDDFVRSEKARVRKVSLRTKTLTVLVFSMSIAAAVCTVISVVLFRKMTIEERTQLALGTAMTAAEVIDGDRVDAYLESNGRYEDYRDTYRLLEKIYAGSPEIEYLYVYRIEEDGCRVVFDIDRSGLETETINTVIPFDEGFAGYIPDLLAGREVAPIITNDRYGHLLTIYQPVYDSDHRCVCYVGADVSMEKLNKESKSFLTEIISVFMGFFVVLCVFTIWLTNYHIIFPVNSIARSMDRIAHTSGMQDNMDDNVKMLRSLDIHTGDELENLFISAADMTKNQAEQMRSIRRLSESTANMQDGLIITMADLVESRDSDTGAHVQKTAAYVKIIVEALRKKGYYVEKITPKFISDVIRSAPLHDVGKINIPDKVLNKPGKLTDEEYEIMKTHTTAGKRIIENAISTVNGDNYLKEARNMAAYHHERWDGKGYPEGIHGEVIPLSARIMAVADVFDALTSPRVYKPAFPIEKALSILEEGKGTQFDPKCVEVFMEALPEVKVILRKYNKDA